MKITYKKLKEKVELLNKFYLTGENMLFIQRAYESYYLYLVDRDNNNLKTILAIGTTKEIYFFLEGVHKTKLFFIKESDKKWV